MDFAYKMPSHKSRQTLVCSVLASRTSGHRARVAGRVHVCESCTPSRRPCAKSSGHSSVACAVQIGPILPPAPRCSRLPQRGGDLPTCKLQLHLLGVDLLLDLQCSANSVFEHVSQTKIATFRPFTRPGHRGRGLGVSVGPVRGRSPSRNQRRPTPLL